MFATLTNSDGLICFLTNNVQKYRLAVFYKFRIWHADWHQRSRYPKCSVSLPSSDSCRPSRTAQFAAGALSTASLAYFTSDCTEAPCLASAKSRHCCTTWRKIWRRDAALGIVRCSLCGARGYEEPVFTVRVSNLHLRFWLAFITNCFLVIPHKNSRSFLPYAMVPFL